MAKFLCDGNPFFQLAQPAKRKTHVLLALVVVIAILVLSILVSGIATLLVGSLLPINREIVSGFFMFTTLILLVWLYTRFVEGRSFKTLGFARENFIPKYFRGFGVGFLLMAGSLLIITLLCDVAIEPPKIEEGVFYTIVSIVLALLFFAIQGAGEEIMFRGWLMQSVGARHWPWLGILLSIVLFMAVHLANPGVNAISIVTCC
jgi:membrane protease YdiL (CAAX protease family)